MKPLSEVKSQKKNLFKNFLLVVILSTGVSLIANAVTKDADLLIAIIPGLACLLFVALYYIKDYFGYSSYEIKLKTVLSVDKDKKVIGISRFRFSEDFSEIYNSVMSENKAYLALWEDAFSWENEKDDKGKKFVNEFLEYLFIHWISLKLNSYFAEIDENATEIIGREQIPDVLIKNRVIELITKPFEEREKFQKRMKEKGIGEGKIVYMNGEDGVVFDRLEIELPRKSKVYREGNTLVINNRNFDIRFDADFQGFGNVLPLYFESFYMNRSHDNVHNYMISLKMAIKLKPFFLLSFKDWEYLGWIDKIGDKFIEYFSFDEFVNNIGYEQAVTNHIIFLNMVEEKKN
jgi:hypothetical protein